MPFMNVEALMQYMDIGGIFVLWILLLCSVLVIAVCLERLFIFMRYTVNSEWLFKQMAVFIGHDRVDDAIQFCAGKRWLLARVFQAGLYRAHCPREDMLDAMNVETAGASRTLEANLSILGTIAVIAPFVGLLGTVLGIIQAFENIAQHGKTGIETVGAGVAEALVTTAAGLFVAILAVIAFNAFKSKIKRMAGDMIDSASRLSEMLSFKKSGTPLPADLKIDLKSPKKEK